ncbi:HAD family hydrolase [Paenibacillus sabinae]|uniref:HAD superfamily hydrolase n=1 Tax=Paenibacillus sabinae T27 TaxID=1268072 RepID=X4ZH12_9BACL|nr:HAD family hydrolase [Paenibacillus sabinae]AHV98786.1 HAD superfamily hydrolase [Paenibacillus sabinae T27]
MKAIGFDLGDTLIFYRNVQASWTDLYEKALTKLLQDMGMDHNGELIEAAAQILKKFNTRINPRDYEVKDTDIFQEILQEWGTNKDIKQMIHTFFSFFQAGSDIFDDTFPLLKYLKERNIKIGILTDVPYGMSRELVMKDLKGFEQYVDVLITSVEVGYRKPRSEGFIQLANQLGCHPEQMSYVGNERKDIVGAKLLGMKGILINRERLDIDWGQDVTISELHEIEKLY